MTDEREHWRAAIHEAAHAVACWHLGVRLELVELYQRGGGTTFVHLFADNKAPASYEEAHRALVVLSAGAAAERHLFGSEEIAADDRNSIDEILAPLAMEPELERSWRKRARREARKIVKANWRSVDLVATELMRRGAMAGGEILRLLGPGKFSISTAADVRWRNEGQIAVTNKTGGGSLMHQQMQPAKAVASPPPTKRSAKAFKVTADGNLLGEVRRMRGGVYEAIRDDGTSIGVFATLAEAARAV
jgi:hypothetical protein